MSAARDAIMGDPETDDFLTNEQADQIFARLEAAGMRVTHLATHKGRTFARRNRGTIKAIFHTGKETRKELHAMLPWHLRYRVYATGGWVVFDPDATMFGTARSYDDERFQHLFIELLR